MYDFIMAEDSELWDNFRAKKILVCGIGPDEYSHILACQSAKEIWEALQTAHEGTTQVKESEIDMLTTVYELFRIKDDKSIQDMHTRFTSIINEIHSLGEIIPKNKLVRKILSVLPSSWESKVPDKRFKRKDVADNVVKQAPAAWGDSSSESGDDDDQGDNFMMAVESEVAEYDSIFALMAKSDEDKEDDDEDDDEDEVNFLDVQRNLKSYSQKKLISLANILIDAYHSLINDKNALTTKLGEIKHERDDLVVVVVDLRETVESLKREKNILTERIANIEHEKDDLLVLVVDLKETIEELRRESRPMNTQKGKEVASEAHPRLENELKSMKSSMCAELEKNRQLQEDLGIVKSDLEKSLKWTWSTDVITAMYTNSGGNRHGIGFQKEKNPKNPRSKYVTVPDNWLCTHCGNTRHVKKTCKVRFQSQQKNKVFAEKVTIAKKPAPSYNKRVLPAWTKRTLIHPFSHYKGPKLVWVLKSNP
ncbi:uncharacterized protein [Nicotiana tomentosiformis]|uniref:uncharacterized protein n=1 Tax=Nicotiana tomentosiformis TaxID=4098 RepID=UPI00388C7D16